MEFLFHFWKVHEVDRVGFRGLYVISEELADTEQKCEGYCEVQRVSHFHSSVLQNGQASCLSPN